MRKRGGGTRDGVMHTGRSKVTAGVVEISRVHRWPRQLHDHLAGTRSGRTRHALAITEMLICCTRLAMHHIQTSMASLGVIQFSISIPITAISHIPRRIMRSRRMTPTATELPTSTTLVGLHLQPCTTSGTIALPRRELDRLPVVLSPLPRTIIASIALPHHMLDRLVGRLLPCTIGANIALLQRSLDHLVGHHPHSTSSVNIAIPRHRLGRLAEVMKRYIAIPGAPKVQTEIRDYCCAFISDGLSYHLTILTCSTYLP